MLGVGGLDCTRYPKDDRNLANVAALNVRQKLWPSKDRCFELFSVSPEDPASDVKR